ncbi:MAG: lysylphosphatidylglycerol synthase domain-containing protein, partial [Prevotella sp.]
KGLAARFISILGHIPGLRGRIRTFVSNHSSQLEVIDRQIAALHSGKRMSFIISVMLEVGVRICSAAEIMFVLLVLSPDVEFVKCILVLAFTSLFANMLFFMPLQLGGREGGFMMSAAGLSMTAGAGVFVALIVRLRELVWTAIGLLLIKVNWRH